MENGTVTTDEDVTEEKEYMENKTRRTNDTEADDGTFFRPNKNSAKASSRGMFSKEDSTNTTYEGEKERPEEGTGFNETEAIVGYGKPTKGSYNSDEKGYKTFGTEGQGENKEGCKDKDSSESSERGMYVTVTAVADQGSDTILLEVGNYDFLDEYSWDEASARVVKALSAIALVTFTDRKSVV